MNFLLGRKLNMTQYFDEASGEVIPVTVIEATPMVVTQVKDAAGKDKYSAVQVGIKSAKGGSASGGKNAGKAIKGHLKDLENFEVLSEFRVEDSKAFTRGQKVEISGFAVGEIVNVIGISKGRGFTGAMKRHGFAGFPASHGHDKPRSVGSIGQRFPQHTRRGLRMAGHYGVESVTIKNLRIIEVNPEKNLVAAKGAVPGHRNGLVKVISTGTVKPLVRIEVIKEAKKK